MPDFLKSWKIPFWVVIAAVNFAGENVQLIADAINADNSVAWINLAAGFLTAVVRTKK